jgi:hypothetical protein
MRVVPSCAELVAAAAEQGCEQALKRMKAAEELSVPGVGLTQWGRIHGASGLQAIKAVELPDAP